MTGFRVFFAFLVAGVVTAVSAQDTTTAWAACQKCVSAVTDPVCAQIFSKDSTATNVYCAASACSDASATAPEDFETKCGLLPTGYAECYGEVNASNAAVLMNFGLAKNIPINGVNFLSVDDLKTAATALGAPTDAASTEFLGIGTAALSASACQAWMQLAAVVTDTAVVPAVPEYVLYVAPDSTSGKNTKVTKPSCIFVTTSEDYTSTGSTDDLSQDFSGAAQVSQLNCQHNAFTTTTTAAPTTAGDKTTTSAAKHVAVGAAALATLFAF